MSTIRVIATQKWWHHPLIVRVRKRDREDHSLQYRYLVVSRPLEYLDPTFKLISAELNIRNPSDWMINSTQFWDDAVHKLRQHITLLEAEGTVKVERRCIYATAWPERREAGNIGAFLLDEYVRKRA